MTKEQNMNIMPPYGWTPADELSAGPNVPTRPRGGDGLACDQAGVALGAADLARVGADAAGRRRCEVRPRQALERILGAAFGSQPEDVILRLDRGLHRAAKAIEAGDLCLAGIEAVLLRLPDLTPQALVKLAEVAKLEKGGTAWQNEPRVPAGQPDGGQWTTADGASGAPTVPAKPAAAVFPYALAPRSEPPLPLDDGVYRPGSDDPHVILVGGAEEEAESRRSNGPPDDYTRLEDVFPGLKEAPGLAIPLAPIDGFFGVSAAADEADAEVGMGPILGLLSTKSNRSIPHSRTRNSSRRARSTASRGRGAPI